MTIHLFAQLHWTGQEDMKLPSLISVIELSSKQSTILKRNTSLSF